MSEIRVCISDSERSISGQVHGSMTDPLIAALTAEPETIAEFETALGRYVKFESDWTLFRWFRQHEDLEPYDAGIVAIDLASRTVGHDTTYSIPEPEGRVKVPSEFADGDDDLFIPYKLPDDWLFVSGIPGFEGASSRRRRERAVDMPFDARPFLYGRPLIAYIACEIAAAHDLDNEDLFNDIHARWIMSPQDVLKRRSPREIFLDKHEFISFDLHTRALQWSFTKVCPKPIAKESFAYVNAGFGTDEMVIHYDLVRFLLDRCASLREAGHVVTSEETVATLLELHDAWLREPNPDLSGRIPSDIIDSERRRLNLTMTAHECLIDEDCPCCVAMAEEFDTPAFWGLDGSGMEYQFEFSFYKTREEWDDEQRRYEEFNKDFEAGKYRWPEDEGEPF